MQTNLKNQFPSESRKTQNNGLAVIERKDNLLVDEPDKKFLEVSDYYERTRKKLAFETFQKVSGQLETSSFSCSGK